MLLQEVLGVYSEKPTERVSALCKKCILNRIQQVVHVVTIELKMAKEF